MKVLYFIIVVFVSVGHPAICQNSFSIPGGEYFIGNILPFEFNDGTHGIIRTIGIEDSFKRYPYLQVITLDECGLEEHWTITSNQITNISRLLRVVQKENLLYVILGVYPGPPNFNFVETGILILNLEDKTTEYHALRGINSINNLDFKILDNGDYMLYNFISYTDQEPTYAIFILSPSFDIIDFYEFDYNFYAIGGNCKEIDDGWICSYGFSIFRLDNALKPRWLIETKDRNNYWQMELVNDGFIVRTARFINRTRHMSLNKFDFDGNLIWRTPNLADETFTTSTSSTSKALIRKDGFLDMVVSNNDYENGQSILYRYVIDRENGNIMEQNELSIPYLNKRFVYRDYYIYKDSTHQLLLADYENNHHIVQFTTGDNSCLSETTKESLLDAAPIVFNKVDVIAPQFGIFSMTSYSWSFVDVPIKADISCSTPYNFPDLLPDDTTACSELGLALDLRDLDLPLTWSDGDTNKLKTVYESKLYSYQTKFCDQSYSESIALISESCDCNFAVPNVFSPNDDGANDQFKLSGNCDFIEDFEISIFDRWGILLFRAQSFDFEWTGIYNGSTVSSGVYPYIIRYTNSIMGQERTVKTGTITVIQ